MSTQSAEPHLYEQYTSLSAEEALQKQSSRLEGLTTPEVKDRLSEFGANILKPNQVSWLTILTRQFQSPFIYILIFAAVLAYALGEFVDGTIILAFVAINAILGFYQEFRSEQALKVLNRYTTPKASVIRNGVEEQVPTPNLVPGDIIILQPGDIIPADARLIQTSNFRVDESILTGESEPRLKTHTALTKKSLAIHEADNIAFSGSNVVSGHATAMVIATGLYTYIGSIAKLTVETSRVSSFEKGMNKLSMFVLRLVGVTLFLLFFTNLMIKGPAADWGDMILFTIALAAAVIPEALPLVITFSLSRGAVRLSKHKVVVKRLSAIEDLGGIEVLCTDKTGTITENKLTVVNTFGDLETVLFQAQAAISQLNKQRDPFDVAIAEAYDTLPSTQEVSTPLHEIPFDPERKRNSVLIEHEKKMLLIVRGAADSILPCSKKKPDSELTKWIEEQEQQGRRVIVLAHKTVSRQVDYDKDLEESDLNITGAIAFSDPLKKSTLSAVKKAQKLGISIKIITGDGAVVAANIAQQIGLIDSTDEVITAQHFFSLSAKQQQKMAERLHVFARFSPHQKHQLIELLQQKHEVGFLGDGINDAPALKAANVALVVQGASDIARESADVILLNSSLSVIVDGIQEGREVFANTIKYIKMTLASNFGNFYAIAMVSLFVDFLPMLPVQILLANLLSDFPLTAVATDSVDQTDISKPESYNLKDFALTTTLFGIVSTIFDFVFFASFYRISPEVLQTNWFIGSILTELVLLYSLRTHLPFFKAIAPSKGVVILSIIAAALTLLLPYTQFGQTMFHFVSPSPLHLVMILVITGAYFILNEVVKVLYYKYTSTKNGNLSLSSWHHPLTYSNIRICMVCYLNSKLNYSRP